MRFFVSPCVILGLAGHGSVHRRIHPDARFNDSKSLGHPETHFFSIKDNEHLHIYQYPPGL